MERGRQALPGADHEHEDDDRRDVARRRASRCGPRARPLGGDARRALTTRLLRRARRPVSIASRAGAQRLAHLGDEREEARVLARLERPRLRQVDLDHPRDPPRPGRHHDHARREEHRLRDRVGDEDDRALRLRPDLEQLPVQALAGHLVERAERLVHQQERRVERERAGDRDALLHAAGELPRPVRPRSPRARRARASPATRSFRFCRSQPSISSGSETFRATVRQS